MSSRGVERFSNRSCNQRAVTHIFYVNDSFNQVKSYVVGYTPLSTTVLSDTPPPLGRTHPTFKAIVLLEVNCGKDLRKRTTGTGQGDRHNRDLRALNHKLRKGKLGYCDGVLYAAHNTRVMEES